MRNGDDATDHGRRFTGLRVTALQVDPGWYEKRWLAEGPARPGLIACLGMATVALGRLIAALRAGAAARLAGRAAKPGPDMASLTRRSPIA